MLQRAFVHHTWCQLSRNEILVLSATAFAGLRDCMCAVGLKAPQGKLLSDDQQC